MKAITPQIQGLREVVGKISAPGSEDTQALQNVTGGEEDNFVLTELLLTRLGCHMYGTRWVSRCVRSTVHHRRNTSEGLHLVGMAGEEAQVHPPPFDVTSENSSPLLLTTPDVQRDLRLWLEDKQMLRAIFETLVGLLSKSFPFKHLSRFLFIDQSSDTDDGKSFGNLDDRGATSVLDELGTLSPKKWNFNPKSFYDDSEDVAEWAAWPKQEVVPYAELKHRIPKASKQTGKHRTKKGVGVPVKEWQALRDKENGFRIVEMGIPNGTEVTIVAKPEYDANESRVIRLVEPQTNETQELQFSVLKGHTIDNFLKQRGSDVFLGDLQGFYLKCGALGLSLVGIGQLYITSVTSK